MTSLGMNWLWSRLLKVPYRRDPIAAFVLTMGAVQVAIGGVDAEAGLAALGLALLGTAAAMYWLKYSSRVIEAARSPRATYASRNSRPLAVPALPDRASVRRSRSASPPPDRGRSPLPPLRLPDRPPTNP